MAGLQGGETAPAVANTAAAQTASASAAGAEPATPIFGADETVDLLTADGIRLRGRWRLPHRPGDARGDALATVVVVHGFSASQDDQAVRALAGDLSAAGYQVLTYDARGHGSSEGMCAVGSTEHMDVACAVDVASLRGLPVVLVGVSMGGVAVAGYLADRRRAGDTDGAGGGSGGGDGDGDGDGGGGHGVAGAVLVSTPSRWRMRPSPLGLVTAVLTRTRLGRWVASRRLRVRIAPSWRVGEPLEALVERIDVPLAVVHGTGDRLLHPEHGRRLHASARGPSRLELVEGMGHGIDVSKLHATVGAVGWVLSWARAAPATTPGR